MENGVAPRVTAARSATWNSGRLPSMIATVSPRRTPSLASPPARASTRCRSSGHVRETLSSGVRTATMPGWLAAVRLSASVSVVASTARPAAVIVGLSIVFSSPVVELMCSQRYRSVAPAHTTRS